MPAIQGDRTWLALLLAPGVGAATAARLIGELGDVDGVLDAPPGELARLGLERAQIAALKDPPAGAMRASMDWLERPGHHLLRMDDPLFPPLLKRIDTPPPALFVAGNPEHLVRPQLAVVGSRNATVGGLDNAREFAGALARAGFVITSGLAAGIDGAAHQAALDAGAPTVAVAGTGLDQVYPARHRKLAARIVDNGAVVSLFPPGAGPRPGNFPARNRIISGMSLGVLVVEAGVQSGSLITARLAGEQGREVFAVPGSIHNPLARGCHRLLRQGARLVETADEILEEIRPLAADLAGELKALLAADELGAGQGQGTHRDVQAAYPPLDAGQRKLLEAVGFDPTPVDIIIQRSGLTTQAVSAMLTVLELEGRVIAHPGGRFSRRTGEENK